MAKVVRTLSINSCAILIAAMGSGCTGVKPAVHHPLPPLQPEGEFYFAWKWEWCGGTGFCGEVLTIWHKDGRVTERTLQSDRISSRTRHYDSVTPTRLREAVMAARLFEQPSEYFSRGPGCLNLVNHAVTHEFWSNFPEASGHMIHYDGCETCADYQKEFSIRLSEERCRYDSDLERFRQFEITLRQINNER